MMRTKQAEAARRISEITRRAARFSRARRKWTSMKKDQTRKIISKVHGKHIIDEENNDTRFQDTTTDGSTTKISTSVPSSHSPVSLSDIRRIYQRRAARLENVTDTTGHHDNNLNAPSKMERSDSATSISSWEMLEATSENEEFLTAAGGDGNAKEWREGDLLFRYLRDLARYPDDLFILGRIDAFFEMLTLALRRLKTVDTNDDADEVEKELCATFGLDRALAELKTLDREVLDALCSCQHVEYVLSHFKSLLDTSNTDEVASSTTGNDVAAEKKPYGESRKVPERSEEDEDDEDEEFFDVESS